MKDPTKASCKMTSHQMDGSSKPQKVKVLDGGLGTELVRNGFSNLDSDPLWSARILRDDPSAIQKVHKSFLDAGSEVIITSTYQASIQGFMKHCSMSREESEHLMASSIDIAKDSVSEYVCKNGLSRGDYYVAASVGPYGACQHDGSEYSGNYIDHMRAEELKEWHRERLKVIVAGEPDLLAIETIPSLNEALLIVELLREFPNTQAWVTFSCKDGCHTSHGDLFRDAASSVLRGHQVVSVGANCCHPEYVQGLITSVRDLLTPDRTLVVYPNIGREYENGQWVPGLQANELSEYVSTWLQSTKVEWIGGCCGSEPGDIRKISQIVKSWNQGKQDPC